MNLSEYIQFVAGLEIEELRKEQQELEKKEDFVKSVLAMKETKQTANEFNEPLKSKAVVTKNDIKYGLLRFPSSTPIAQSLKKGATIIIEYKGRSFECSVPRLERYPNQKGRINGLKKVYDQFEEFVDGRTVVAELDISNSKVKILEVV